MIPPYHWIKFELKLKKSEVKLRHFCRYVTRESNTIKTLNTKSIRKSLTRYQRRQSIINLHTNTFLFGKALDKIIIVIELVLISPCIDIILSLYGCIVERLLYTKTMWVYVRIIITYHAGTITFHVVQIETVRANRSMNSNDTLC
jgi:hypothetical protein